MPMINDKVDRLMKETIRQLELELMVLREELERANDTNQIQDQLDLSRIIALKTQALEDLKSGFKLIGGVL